MTGTGHMDEFNTILSWIPKASCITLTVQGSTSILNVYWLILLRPWFRKHGIRSPGSGEVPLRTSNIWVGELLFRTKSTFGLCAMHWMTLRRFKYIQILSFLFCSFFFLYRNVDVCVMWQHYSFLSFPLPTVFDLLVINVSSSALF